MIEIKKEEQQKKAQEENVVCKNVSNINISMNQSPLQQDEIDVINFFNSKFNTAEENIF